MKRLLLLVGMLTIPSFAAVSANVSFASDYVWRGMTQSDGPAIQGGFDFEAESGFYAGIWGSNVNFNNGAGSELDLYLGYGFEVGSVGVDVGYISYEYIDSTPDATFDETYLGLSFGDFGVSFAFGDYDYTEVSYALGDVSFSYGDYDEYGENTTISYGFACGSYECGISVYDFSDAGYGADEDGVFFSISASL